MTIFSKHENDDYLIVGKDPNGAVRVALSGRFVTLSPAEAMKLVEDLLSMSVE